MPIASANLINVPRIIRGSGEDGVVHDSVRLRTDFNTDAHATHGAAIWPGSFLTNNIGGVTLTGSCVGVRTAATNYGQSAGWQTVAIYNTNGNRLPYQYLSTTDLDAADYIIEAIPLGGCSIEISENSSHNPITDIAAKTGYFCEIYVTDPVAADVARDKANNPFGQATGVIKLTSVTAAFPASRTAAENAEMFQFEGIAGGPENPAFNASTSIGVRNFIVKIASPDSSQ